jgi:hypothetical protein
MTKTGKMKEIMSMLIVLEVTKEMGQPRFAESTRKEEKGNRHVRTRSPKCPKK